MLVFSSSIVIAVLVGLAITGTFAGWRLVARKIGKAFHSLLSSWEALQLKRAAIRQANAEAALAEEKARNEALKALWPPERRE